MKRPHHIDPCFYEWESSKSKPKMDGATRMFLWVLAIIIFIAAAAHGVGLLGAFIAGGIDAY